MFGFLKKRGAKREIIVNAEGLETRVALMVDSRLEEFQVEHPTQQRVVGSIYKGRIQNLEHDLQAAFVDIGMRKNAFIHYWDMIPEDGSLDAIEEEVGRRRRPRKKRQSKEEMEKQFPIGSELVIQISKGPIGTKGPRATTSLSIPGRYLVLIPGARLRGVSRKIESARDRQSIKKAMSRLSVPKGVGVIARTAAAGVSRRNLARDLAGLLAAWDGLQDAMKNKKAPCCIYEEPDLVERVIRDSLTEDVDRVIVDNREKYEVVHAIASRISRKARSSVHLYEGDLPIFDYHGVERQLDEAFRRRVDLKCGGYIVFDEAEALIAVDVNTGRYRGKGSQDEAILEVNTEAVLEVARQLRLRNIGGLVIIDLIDMRLRRHQTAVFRAMKDALRDDRARTNVLPISDLGILEMTRQRAEESIMSSVHMDCPYCQGRGVVKSPLGMSVEIQRQVAAAMRKYGQGEQPASLLVEVHPAVLERLKSKDEQFLLDIQAQFEGKLSFRSDPAKHMEAFCIRNADTKEALYTNVRK